MREIRQKRFAKTLWIKRKGLMTDVCGFSSLAAKAERLEVVKRK